LGIALSAVLVLPVIGLLPNVIFRAHSFFAPFGLFLMFQILLSITVMILPTLLIGATFPCAVQLVARQISRIGKDVGFVYSYNTIGAIVGSFIAGFFMIPLIGSEATIRVGVVVNFLVGFGVLFVFYSAFQMRLGVIVSSGLAVLIVFSFPHWDPRVMTSGIRIYAPSYAKTFSTLGDVLQDEEILFKKDGISSTVSIHKRAGITFLRVNGKTDASNGSDMGTQLLVGHLPSLLHPNPRSAFIVGLGSGVTPGAIARYPLERIDVVEIEPAMVEASSFFVAENRGVLSDPRVKLHHGDAKNVLLRSDEKYDLIINEPSNPWINGIATLFTEEFFALTRSRLNPEGVMVQWLQGYALSREDMRTVIATFLKVYPHASLWQASNVDYILVGGDGP
ncbi:MAG TPA: fused MFS/spermidine synthase, partial [Nitrospiria bacterium]|nr:fused MFS/spermidine synthase [Nitrospiria bacterium]